MTAGSTRKHSRSFCSSTPIISSSDTVDMALLIYQQLKTVRNNVESI
jgi:hypothetical protein